MYVSAKEVLERELLALFVAAGILLTVACAH